MPDRGTPRYTAASEPAHEAHIAQDLSRAATGIASELGDAVSALWLVGAFAHGVSVLDLLFNTGPDAPRFMKTFAGNATIKTS